MKVKELKGVLVNSSLIYHIMSNGGFDNKYLTIPQCFYEFEVIECYIHANEFACILDILIEESGELK